MLAPTLTLLPALLLPSVERPLDPHLVPAETPFLVHVDLQTLFSTQLFRRSLQEAHVDPDSLLQSADLGDLAQLARELDFDPLRDVLSLTVFSAGGADASSEDGVAVLRTSDRLDSVLEHLRGSGKLREGEMAGRRVYGVDDALAYVHPTSEGRERLVVLADDEAQLWGAIQVLDGSAPSLAARGAKALLSGDGPQAGAFLLVEVGEALAQLVGEAGGPASQVGRYARGFSLQLGERGERFFLDAALLTDGDSEARDVANIVQGLRSLLSLVGEDELPEAARDLIDDVRVEARGNRVRLHLEADVEDLLEDVSAIQHGR